ncbi:COR domain-containing protein [Spirosoma litoris]
MDNQVEKLKKLLPLILNITAIEANRIWKNNYFKKFYTINKNKDITSLSISRFLYPRGIRKEKKIVNLFYLREFNELKGLYLSDVEISKTKENFSLESLISLQINSNFNYSVFKYISIPNLSELHLTNGDTINLKNFFTAKKFTSLKILNLSNNKISNIEALSTLKNLEILNLSNNEISDFEPLSDLVNIKKLDLSFNKISHINPLLYLEKLNNINLSNNRIEDISVINKIKLIKTINLESNLIEKIPYFSLSNKISYFNIRNNYIIDISELSNLKMVKVLDLSNNQIIEIYPLEKLEKLEKLYLSHNKITNISPIINLISLKELTIRKNPIIDLVSLERIKSITLMSYFRNNYYFIDFDRDIKPNLKSMNFSDINDWTKNLTFTENSKKKIIGLYLRKKKLSDLSFLKDYPDLEILDIRQNEILDLSYISSLKKLKQLHLYDNNIHEITMDFLNHLPDLEYLNIRLNPVKNIPREIYDKDENTLNAIKIYLKSLSGQLTSVYQAKLILIGNGEVGKSSIRIKLLDKDAKLPDKKDRTQGLDISIYTIKDLAAEITNLDQNIDFNLSIWDFGGQGKYREIQQVFCSRKALYVYVTSVDDLPTKEDYVGYEYWLSMSKAFGYDKEEDLQSPAIYVLNKCDLGTKRINEEELFNSFNNIHDFIKISCDTLYNFGELEKSIRNALPKVSKDIFNSLFSQNWFNVKQILDTKRKDNYILLDEYREICSLENLSIDESDIWLKYLDRIGDIIYFQSKTYINDFIVLNPLWVKNSIYKILDSKFVRRGILEEDFISDIWPETDYSSSEHEKLIDLMVFYKFCYKQIDLQNKVTYIVPSLLPEKNSSIPDFFKKFDYEICFKYSPFIPAGTVNKLIVDLFPNIYQDFKWKNGCILHLYFDDEVSFAEVTESWEDKAVYVRLKGHDVSHIYEFIKKELMKLNKELKDAKMLDKLEIEISVKYEDSYHLVKSILAFGKYEEFYFLFGRRDNKTLKNTMETLPDFFTEQLKVQLEEQYKIILRYRQLKNNEIDKSRRNLYQEEIDLRNTNIVEIENNFLVLVKSKNPSVSENIIMKAINETQELIQREFGIVNFKIDELHYSIEEIEESINEKQVDLEGSENKMAIELISVVLERLDKLDYKKRLEVQSELSADINTSSKLKFIIPIIPTILQYETELNISSKQTIKSWKDFWGIFYK